MKALYAERTVDIPAGCTVKVTDGKFLFEGPLGKQEYDASKEGFTFEVKDKQVLVKRWHANRAKLQLINTVASHIRNNMKGVTIGFKYVLKSVFRHFPIQISVSGNGKEVKVHTFLGSKEERTYPVRGASVAIPGETKDLLVIQGTSLLDVSQTAASISSDSFKRKKHDERIFLDGIYIFEKLNMIMD
ncbi:60S ribosomal protein L9 [Glugoides intestinalis]